MKVQKMQISGINPDLYQIEARTESEFIGVHWLKFTAIRTASGWQVQDGEKRQIFGTVFADVFAAADAVKHQIEFNPATPCE